MSVICNSNLDSFKLLICKRYLDQIFVDDDGVKCRNKSVNELECVRCKDVALLPKILNCQHVLCSDCSCIMINRLGHKCPKCKAPITQINNCPKSLEMKINILKIKCLNHEFGCSYVNELQKVCEHFNSCKITSLSSLTEKPIIDTTDDDIEWNETLQRANKNAACKEYNILFLGSTGVGKSTFVNALVNYLKYENFNTAKNSNLEVLIPCKFTMWNNKFEQQEVQFGSDPNEKLEAGQSSTQRCKSHRFTCGQNVFRLIDTPGISDTKGVERDILNLDETLKIVKEIQHLHVICLMLKPNESKFTVGYRYAIKKLLTSFRDITGNNIVFVFTNSRGTFYKPGDTIEPLKALLHEIKMKSPSLDIPLNKNNVFCLDNEAFRFLLAMKQGVRFTKKQTSDFSESWMTSGEECKRLIKHVLNTGIDDEKRITPNKFKPTIEFKQVKTRASLWAMTIKSTMVLWTSICILALLRTISVLILPKKWWLKSLIKCVLAALLVYVLMRIHEKYISVL